MVTIILFLVIHRCVFIFFLCLISVPLNSLSSFSFEIDIKPRPEQLMIAGSNCLWIKANSMPSFHAKQCLIQEKWYVSNTIHRTQYQTM